MSTTHKVLLLVLGLAYLALAVRMIALSRESVRTGQQIRDLSGALPTVLVSVLLSVALGACPFDIVTVP